jgi:hypothetical protein
MMGSLIQRGLGPSALAVLTGLMIATAACAQPADKGDQKGDKDAKAKMDQPGGKDRMGGMMGGQEGMGGMPGMT